MFLGESERALGTQLRLHCLDELEAQAETWAKRLDAARRELLAWWLVLLGVRRLASSGRCRHCWLVVC